jgi:hypothetical protein
VVVKLESQRPTYKIGDPILLRITIRNTSGQVVRMLNGTHTNLASIRVLDAKGHEVKRARSAEIGGIGGPLLLLRPGATRILKAPNNEEWLSLRDWGYDIRVPGEYRIIGFWGTSSADPSNRGVMSNSVGVTLTN